MSQTPHNLNKEYWLFGVNDYQNRGGLGDIELTFDDHDTLRRFFEQESFDFDRRQYYYIFNYTTRKDLELYVEYDEETDAFKVLSLGTDHELNNYTQTELFNRIFQEIDPPEQKYSGGYQPKKTTLSSIAPPPSTK